MNKKHKDVKKNATKKTSILLAVRTILKRITCITCTPIY